MSRSTPFRKILIANRGEIALRVARTARWLGYRTVAVYSSADARARHALEADQAVWIGESLPAQSYLNIPAIIGAARATGADAVHPGYGFLAENAAFARACRDAGLVFIGPSPEAIDAMGDKARAKGLMAQAGVPCIPGYAGSDQSEATLAAEAARIGYPVMIKAVAGGGGRGMRLVEDADRFVERLRSAQSEATNSFGDGTVLLERALVEPRHIEIQVFADRHGHAIHLGERDCSVQRRHQKLIEESPSPAVSPELRARMGADAVAAAKAIGYEGAGTLEFLLDREGRYYFMEMNTRLQVEHPVTEAITGLDLVALQLRVAAGEPLRISQDDVRFAGHAIEVRLCAEDAAQGFVPHSGTLARWQPPSALRIEHALADGCAIPPFYDSMIAKVIAHGASREDARRALVAGLEDLVALGVTTNQSFLARCLEHPVFAAGAATTGFVAEHLDALLRRDDAAGARAAALAAVLLQETAPEAGSSVLPSGSPRGALRATLPVAQRFEFDGRSHTATLAAGEKGPSWRVRLGDRQLDVELVAIGASDVRFVCDGVMESAAWWRDGTRLLIGLRGAQVVVRDTTRAASARAQSTSGDGRVRATMNGRVVAVHVAVGDRVEAGQPLLTLEAMKMEHVHASPAAGTVGAVHVHVGQQVAASRVLAEVAPASG